MKIIKTIIGVMLIIGLAFATVGCSGKIGKSYNDRSWQRTPPGTGGGK